MIYPIIKYYKERNKLFKCPYIRFILFYCSEFLNLIAIYIKVASYNEEVVYILYKWYTHTHHTYTHI